MKRLLWIVPVIVVLFAAAWYLLGSGSGGAGEVQRVKAAKGTVVRKATAVGRIEVEHEVPVNSSLGGIVTKIFVRPGQKVVAGEPLAEVRPVITENSLYSAERSLELARQGEENALEYKEGKHPAAWLTRLFLGEKNIERMTRSATIAREQTEAEYERMREGKARIEKRTIDYIVRAPVASHVLEIRHRVGAPVVPSSIYGSGTYFIALADMDRMLFRGTVDEIDVGRLKEGMAAQIKVGALPGTAVGGKLEEISLKAQERNNAMVFEVLIRLETRPEATLRSGYSAVAEIDVDRRDDVLVLPERVVEFRGGKAFVRIPDGRGGSAAKEIETGLSDGLTVEVKGGLAEGQEVLERTHG